MILILTFCQLFRECSIAIFLKQLLTIFFEIRVSKNVLQFKEERLTMSFLRKNKFFLLLIFAIASCTTAEPISPPSNPIPIASPRMDCQVMHPKLYGHYVGDCQNGKAHGQGFAVGKDKYKGGFIDGLPHGQGTYTWADEESFVGQFKQGFPQIPHIGCYVADPRLRGAYKGECRNNKANGRGLAKGIDTYNGNFINGVVNGQGTYVWPNGDRFLGEFKDGNVNGRGEMQYVDGTRETGIWQNNQLVRKFIE